MQSIYNIVSVTYVVQYQMYVIYIFGIKHVKKKWMGVITGEKGITNVTKTWAIDNRILNNAACSEISGYLGPDQLYEEHRFTQFLKDFFSTTFIWNIKNMLFQKLSDKKVCGFWGKYLWNPLVLKLFMFFLFLYIQDLFIIICISVTNVRPSDNTFFL